MPGPRSTAQRLLLRTLVFAQVFLLVASLFAPIPVLASDPVDPSAPPESAQPSADPTAEPTAEPSPSAAPDPTEAPSAEPTPASVPTAEPTSDPTEPPTAEPTVEPTAAPTEAPTAAPVTTTQYIVAFDPSTSAAFRLDALAAAGVSVVDAIPALGMYAVAVPDGSTAVADLRAASGVLRVDLDRVRDAEAVPSDPRFADQWALERIGWTDVFGNVSPAGDAVVALLDTGVDASHPDLAGQLVAGASMLDGVAATDDPNGHGTWLAGIIAAATDNGTGIAGVGYAGVRVMPVTVLGADGTGQDSDIIEGVVWAVQHGADVINMSFSNPGYSASLQAAIDYAWAHDVVVVAATGNDGSSNVTFPAGDRGVVGVSATDPSDVLAPFSNHGADTFLAAPGVDILTTAPGGGSTSISGTSASSAIVAAAAALLRAIDPGASNGVIVNRLAESADPGGTVAETGNGRLNLARAVADASAVELQPAGAAPVGDGGPFVGPYVAANVQSVVVTFPVDATNYSTTSYTALCSTPAADVCGTAAWSGNTTLRAVAVSIKRSSDNLYWTGSAFTSAAEVFNAATCGTTSANGCGPNSNNSGTVLWTMALPSQASGSYVIRARAVDSGDTAFSLANTFTMDTTAPTVLSINRVTPSPTNATSLQWLVTFSESVTGGSTANFATAATGTTGSIASVTGTGATRTVTVNGVSGNGTLGVNLTSNTGIADAVGNALATTTFTGLTYVVDTTAPTVSITAPLGNTTQTSTAVGVTWTESDTGSGLNAASRSVQRQKATPVGNACTAVSFANDGAATTAASPRNDTGLLTNTCYRWTVSINDNAGNTGSATSGTVLVDTTAPTVTFTSPSANSTQSSTSVNVTWTEADAGSGVNAASRSVQRQSGAPVANSCATASFANDGAATSSASPRNDTGLLTNTCYRWQVTLADNLGNSATTTSATVLVDTTAPTVSITAPLGNTTQTSTAVGVTWTESDTGSGLNAASRSVQRQKATPVGNACTAVSFANDGAATTAASPRNDTGLLTNTCYRWTVSINDNAGNTGSATSGTVLVDTTAPTVTFTSPSANSTQSSTSVNVTWTEADAGSGVNAASRSVQRQSGAPVANSCATASFANDGAATSSASPRNDTGLLTNTCYRWQVTLADNLGNSATTTSATVLVDTTAPTVSITAPLGNTTQTSTAVGVTWTESDTGSGLNAASRSVQRQKATPVGNACTAVSFANDGAATTAASPRNDTGLLTNTCYRWTVSINDNAGNTGSATSGTVLVDTTAPTVTIDSLVGTAGTDSTSPFAVFTNNGATINWHATESGSFEIRRGGSTCSNGTVVATGTYTAPATVGTSLSNAMLSATKFRVCVTDSATNTGASEDVDITLDVTAPTVTITAPLGALIQASTSRAVTWTELDGGSGLDASSRSVQRQSGAPVANACATASFANDGAATSSASPRNDTGLATNTCYRWVVSISDNAGNTGSATSGTVLVDTTAPTVSITAPLGNTTQTSTAVGVTWTESDTGSGLNAASRSVQRQKATPVGNACTAVSFANDGAATTAASPRNDTGLLTNTCYRWTVSINDNAGNTGSATSGTVLISSATTTTITLTTGSNPSVYGDTLEFTATVTGAGATPTGTIQWKVDGANFGAMVFIDGSAQATLDPGILSAGIHTIDATYGGDGSHSGSAAAQWSQSVNKAAADCTSITGFSGVYDGNAHGATGDCFGVDGTTVLAGLSLGASFTNVPGGTASWSFIDVTGNYENQSGTANIVISKAAADCTSITGFSGVYDGNAHGATGDCFGVDGTTVLAGLSLGASFTNVPGGTASWSFIDVTGNYENQSGTANIVISKAAADCTSITGFSGVYDGNAHGATGDCFGVDGTTVLAGLSLGASFTNVPGGTASWSFIDVTGNYENQSGTADFTVNARPLTITATDRSKTYGSSLSLGTTGFTTNHNEATGEAVTAVTLTSLLNRAGDTTTAAGAYADNIVPSAATGTGGFLATNYAITYVKGKLTVDQAVLSVDAVDAAKTYGNGDPAFTFTLSGFVNGENATTAGVTGSATCSRSGSDSAVGTYLDVLSCSPIGLLAANYGFIAGDTADFTINARPLTITATDRSKTYGSSLSLGTTGFTTNHNEATGEAVTAVTLTSLLNRAGDTTTAAGAYADNIVPSAATGTGGFLATNYAITYVKGKLTVDQAVLSVNAVANTKVYGSIDPAFSWTYSGFVNSDNATNSSITGSASCTRTPGSMVLGSPYTITCAPGGLLAPNYTFATGASAAFTITKAGSTVTVTCPAGPYTYTGLPQTPCTASWSSTGADAEGASLTPGYTDNVNAGAAHVSATFAGDDNHTGNSGTGSFTIDQADAIISVSGYSGQYDANFHGATGTATGVLGEALSAGLSLGATFRNVPGGTANWSFHDASGNHKDASGSVSITISTRALALNAVPDSKVADGNTSSTATPSIVGLQGTDTVTGLLQAFDSPAAGARILSVQPGYTVNDGNATGDNYVVSLGTATGSISPAAANRVVITAQPLAGTVNQDLEPALDVEVQDQFGNLVPGVRPITLSLYNPFPETAWLSGFLTVNTAADGTASFADLDIDTPGVFVIEAASTGLTSALSADITISTGSLFSSVAAGDPDWQNQIDGVDVLFQKTGSGSSTKYTLKATNPGTFMYRLSLTNETGSEIHVKGRQLPNIIRNGVSLKDRNGATVTVFLTVPSMPASVGTDWGLSVPDRNAPAFVLTGNRPVRAHPDDRSDDLPITVSWAAELPAGFTRCEDIPANDAAWKTTTLGDGAIVRCIRVEGLEIRQHHDAHVHVAYEFRWKNSANWGSPTSDSSQSFRAGFNFTSTTKIRLDDFNTDLVNFSHDHWNRLPAAQKSKLLSDFTSLWNTDSVGRHALGLSFAGEKVTAVGGFVFDPNGQGIADVLVRAFSAKPTGDACAPLAYGANNLVAEYTTGSDGFYFLWQKNADNTGLDGGSNTLASGFKYYLALCEGSGLATALPFDQLYWPARAMDHTLGSKEFDEEDFFVSGPTRLAFQSQPISGKRNTTLPTVKVALLDGFGNVMTMDSTSRVTLSASTSAGTSTALTSTQVSQPLADRTLTNGVVTWTGLRFSATGLYKLEADSSVGGVPDEKSLPINIAN